ncbi:5-oxoprolinase/urea amidolyase family protein [Leucobacter viscericola]|uniref:5-oxoprolinase/urea amidolyase family protein n=1 Tax=Leucobacter viscericola TaxID=2714935 RepID=A0A6G7XGA7_9MICO|nr:urea amidolyase family protein [Leucobacter viscericola]QIK63506.1 5-oxoprolinase/urea amidolyase family protein [Leucobacter viscericola]
MTSEPRILPAGATAVLLECGTLDRALQVFASLTAARDRGELDVAELVPAAETVLVSGGEARDPRALRAKLRDLLSGSGSASARAAASAETVIPVFYRGEDLDEVATLTGMSAEQVVQRHTAAAYTVAFTGFAPGFAYLSGGDPLLEVPRRATPRPRILPGSVGLAGPFSGVYPRESPGGWQIIGHTDHPMWDLDRERPAALLAGEGVRFVAERERVVAADPGRSAQVPAPSLDHPAKAKRLDRGVPSAPALTVIDAGLQTLIEDAGRLGASGMGVGESGVSIRRAYQQANRLVGNRPGAAALELSHGGFAVEAVSTTVLALAGAPRVGQITGPFGTRGVPEGQAFRLSVGERLTLGAPSAGLRSVLALRGGVAATPVLGSRSRDTLAGLGPESLIAGDTISVASEAILPVSAPEATAAQLPAAGEVTTLRVILGPRDGWFDEASIDRFFAQSWDVTPRSDRVGVRLAGDALTRSPDFDGKELPSEGMVLGAIQIPPDGQPVLFLADRPLTGGYPVIAVVHDDDIELAAQLAPGCRVRFDLFRDGSASTEAVQNTTVPNVPAPNVTEIDQENPS